MGTDPGFVPKEMAMQINVTVERKDGDLFAEQSAGVLTDEHAASCHGQPVVVVDGVAHGPGDLAGRTVSVAHELAPATVPAWEYESDEQLRSRRTPESLDLVRRAREAGYTVA